MIKIAKNLHHILAYLGTIPFVAAAIFFTFGLDFISPISVENIIKSYILAIISFMAGANWGQYLSALKKPALNLFIISNVLTLLCWFSFFLLGSPAFLLNAVFIFISLLLIDHHLLKLALIEKNYFKTRVNVSAVVCLSVLLIRSTLT
jgi:hypothetical protein